MKLKCQCCGIDAEFEDSESAFYAGWDAPPHFTTHICCDLCPAVCIVLGAGHTKAHAGWAKNGRPEKFGARCVTDKEWGVSEEKFESQIAQVEKAFQEAAGKKAN